ncbi:MAG: tripartite tricarboxylate transporter substrate binding protein [Deltaproteobacteria bacterium]|nr:tripartite tricarboxylate transporter substrate binding protein [Deltaproteobacteria bacterium]
MKTNRFIAILLVVFLAIFSQTGTAFAQGYPSKAIKLVAPFGAGGSTDSSARIFARYLEKYLGTNVAVVNIKGAAGTIGSMQVYKSTPDGYTLLWHHLTLLTSYHTGVGKFTWDSLTPVCQGVKFYMAITVHKDSPWKTIHDLIKDAQARPGKIKWGVNIGAGLHFIAIGLEVATDTKFHYVAGGGDRSQTTALLGKHIDVSSPSDTVVLQYVRTGQLRVLATTGEKRLPTLPDVPTLKEEGIDYTFYFEPSLFGPPGLPAEVIRKLNNAVQKVMQDPEAAKDFRKIGMYPNYLEHNAFKKRLLKLDAQFYMFARKGGLIPSRIK